jgi:signal transduction histidine kinase
MEVSPSRAGAPLEVAVQDRLSPLLLAGSALFAAVAGVLALGGTWHQHPGYAVGTVLVTVSLLVTGYGLARSSRTHRAGLWILVGGGVWPAYWADIGQAGVGPFCSWVAENAVWGVFGTAFLSFPGERRRSRTERRFLTVMWVSVALGALALVVVSRPEWLGFSSEAWWPGPWRNRPAFVVTLGVFALGRLLLAVGGTRLVLARLRAASGLDQALLRPALVGLVLSTVVVVATGVLQELTTSDAANAAAKSVQGLSLMFLPVVLLLSLVQTRLVRADMVDRIIRLPRPATTGSVEAALRAALHDDTLEVLPGPTGEGSRRPSAGAGPERDRYVVPVRGSDGRDVAVVTCDPRLRERASLVQTAVQVAGLELENVGLHAGLQAQMEQLRLSRARLVEAGQSERRRLERDLHDGAQQHMLAIALHIEHARIRAGEPEVERSLQQIKDEMQGALSEIRDLARGIQPGVLVQAGLRPALLALADGMPLPVRIDMPEQRYPQQVESAAYFVASEALSNIVKHARARHASVSVRLAEAGLQVVVVDDGTGAARMAGGSGLRGLADRVQGLGGQVDVSGRPGAGSRVEATIPCG